MTLLVDSIICDKRLMARDLARRSSDDFRETYGHSPLDSVAPFQRDEIILGRRVGAGSFSNVYDIQDFNLSSKTSKKYTDEQVKKREAIAKSVRNGAKYVIKCLKDNLEDDEDHFHLAAQDIIRETEVLAALNHPNIIKLHGVVNSRHNAFLEGASEYFIILEKLDCTLQDKLNGWAKNSFNPSRSLRSLRSSFNTKSPGEAPLDEERSIHSRLRVASFLASAVDCLHKQGVIFRDLKPDNVGFDRHGNVKLFDFGLSRFMPQGGDHYKDVHEMSGSGTPRYTSPEVVFYHPYNLKSDVYSFSVVLWEILTLKKPFSKYKNRKDLEKALSKVECTCLTLNQRWPQPIQDIIKSGLSRDLWARPKMSEVCKILNECTAKGVAYCNGENVVDPRLTKSLNTPSRLPSKRGMHSVRQSLNSSFKPKNNFLGNISETSGSSGTMDNMSYEEFVRIEGEKWDKSLHSLDSF